MGGGKIWAGGGFDVQPPRSRLGLEWCEKLPTWAENGCGGLPLDRRGEGIGRRGCHLVLVDNIMLAESTRVSSSVSCSVVAC